MASLETLLIKVRSETPTSFFFVVSNVAFLILGLLLPPLRPAPDWPLLAAFSPFGRRLMPYIWESVSPTEVPQFHLRLCECSPSWSSALSGGRMLHRDALGWSPVPYQYLWFRSVRWKAQSFEEYWQLGFIKTETWLVRYLRVWFARRQRFPRLYRFSHTKKASPPACVTSRHSWTASYSHININELTQSANLPVTVLMRIRISRQADAEVLHWETDQAKKKKKKKHYTGNGSPIADLTTPSPVFQSPLRVPRSDHLPFGISIPYGTR